MSLDLGTLTGYLDIDSSRFDGALDRMPERVRSRGNLLKLAAGGVALGLGAALAGGVDQGLDMSAAGAKLGAQLGLTTAESANVGKLAGKLYAENYGSSIEDVSGAIGNVMSSIRGMRGASDKTVEAMTAKFLNFNATFEVDTARSTQVVGQLLSSGLVKTADEGVDLLTKAFQKVPANVRDDLLDASDEYSPFFKQIGLTGADSMNALVQASAKGAFGIDKTGDAVKEFTIRATDLSDTNAQASLKALGLNGKTTADQLLKGGASAKSAFSTIVKGLEGVKDPGKQAMLSTQLFGTQLEDMNKGQLAGFLHSLDGSQDALGKTGGAADAMGKQINGSASAGFESLRRQFLGIVGTVGEQLIPILTTVTKWFADNPAMIYVVVGVIGALAVAFIALSVAAWIAAAAEGAAFLPILLIVAGVALLVAAIVLLVTHWGQVTAFLQAAWAAFTAWIMAGLQGLASFWSGVWNGIVSTVQNIWNGFVGWLRSGFVLLVAIVAAAIEIVKSRWNAGWNAVVSFAQGVLGAVVSFIRGKLTEAQAVVAAVIAGIRAVWAAGWGFVRSAVSTAVGAVLGAARSMTTGVSSTVNGVVGFFRKIPGQILSALSGAGSMLLGIGRNIVDGLKNGISNAWGSVTSMVSGLTDKLPAIVKKALGIHSPSTVFRALGRYTVQGFALGITGSQSQITSAMTAMNNKVVDAFNAKAISRKQMESAKAAIHNGNRDLLALAKERDGVATKLVDAQKKLADAQKQSADYQAGIRSNIVDSVKTASTTSVGELVSDLKTRVTQTKTLTSDLAKLRKMGLDDTTYQQLISGGLDSLPIASALVAGGKGAVSQISGLQKQLGSAANSLASSTANQLYGAGISMAQGIVKGLQSQQKQIDKTMDSVADSLVHRIKVKLGIHSPSRVLRDVGVNTGQGLVNGLSSMLPAVSEQMAALVTPPSSIPLVTGLGKASGAAAVGAGGIVSTATLTVNGNVGWDADEVARKMGEQQRQALALTGIGNQVLVAG